MNNNISWEEYIDLCYQAIQIDENFQNRELGEFWKKKLAVRVEEGKAIKNVQLVSYSRVGRNYILNFFTNEKTGQFRAGDYILITEPESGEYPDEQRFSSKGTITKFERTSTGDGIEIEVKMYDEDVKYEFKTGKKYFIDEAKKSFSTIIRNVLEKCKDRRAIEKILLGGQKEENNFKEPLNYFKNFCEHLNNESQEEAIKKASQLKQYGFYYIQGPPGTGKTLTLARLAALLSRYGSVGMIAFTHRAINKFVNTACEYINDSKLKNIKIHRIAANGYQVEDLEKSWVGEGVLCLEDSFSLNIGKGNIYAATIHKFASSYKLFQEEHTKFDWLIFDEAGQISIPYIIASMFFGKRFIFCGDHKQLSPVVSLKQNEDNKKIIEVLKSSVLQQLVKQYRENSPYQTTLNVTYRLNSILAEFPNKEFYDSKIQVRSDHKEEISPDNSIIGQIIGNDEPVIFIDVPKLPEVKFAENLNGVEARIVAEICKYLIDYYKNKNCHPETIISEKIGVVSPYRNHCQQINRLVGCEVADTVERFQGQEREIMIISYANTSPPNDDRINFIYNPNRLNVAITRAKKKLIIVGNRKLFINGTELFRKYFLYLQENKRIKQLTKDELLSILAEKTQETGTYVPSKPTIDAPLSPSKIANRYILKRELHQGGMGILYLAEDTENNGNVVLKKLREDLGINHGSVEKFRSEAQILNKVKVLPGVVQIYNDELICEKGEYYIVMEYINGSSLDTLISLQGRIELSRAITIVSKLCDILDSIHSQGIVHLDLKPNNIMIINDTEIKLTDFGIAKMLYEEKMVEGISGTPDYMAPEQHKGEKCEKYTDIYALGIIFYEMLTGEMPFKASDMQTWCELKERNQYESVKNKLTDIDSQVAERIDQIISKCLQPKPQDRYQSAKELKEGLESINEPKMSYH